MNLDPVSLTVSALGAVAVVFCCLLLFQHFPRLCLSLFLVFILFQWIIVNWLGGKSFSAGRALTYLDEGVILALFLLVALDTVIRGKTVRLTMASVGIGVFLLAGIIGNLIGRTPFVIVISDIFIYLKGFLLFMIFAYFVYPPEKLKNQIMFFAILGLIIVLLGLVELVNPIGFRSLTGNVTRIYWRAGIPSVQSTFIHPGLFGWFCGYNALFALAFYLCKRRLGSLVLFIIFILGGLISMRLKVFGAVTVSILFALWLYVSRAKVKLVLLIGTIAVLFLVVFRSQIGGVISEQIEEYKHPLKPRTVLYKTSYLLAKKYFPFGVGFGRYGGDVAARYYSPVYHEFRFEQIHGLWPEGQFLRDTFWPMVLGELGVIGLVAYCAVLALLFRILLRSYRSADSILASAFTLGTCLVFIEGLVESLAEPVFTKPPACYFIFAAMGISYSLYTRRLNSLTAQADTADRDY